MSLDSIGQFFSSRDFMPHGHSFLWRPDILWVRVCADGVIALSYFSIPLGLLYLIRKRSDLEFNWIFVMLAVFIFGCGTTHALGVWTIWFPHYGVENLVKISTAIASVATATALWRMIPKALSLPRSTELLQESQKKYEELVNTIDGIVWEANVGSSPYTFVSRQAERILGYPVERWLKEPGFWQKIIHPEDLKNFIGTNYVKPAEKRDRQTEYRVFTAEGKMVWVKDFVTVIFKNGEPSQLRGIMVDITERKKAEERLTIAVGAAQMGNWDLDLVNDTMVTSPRHDQIFGYPSPQQGWTTDFFFKHILPEDLDHVKACFEQAAQSGQLSADFRIAWHDKSVHWVSSRGRIYRDILGRAIRMAGIVMDVTDLKKTEQAALEASNLKSQFLANMSHEIRTPLNAIIGMASLVLDTKLDERQKDDIMTIKRSGDALLSLVNDILDFSKIEAGKLELEVLDFDLREVLKSSLELVSLNADRKGLETITRVADDVPNQLRGDSGRLLQVLMNLLSNAVKFTERGSVELSVSINAQASPRPMLRFEVRDTGIGMTHATLGQLFNPFSQGDGSMGRKYGGTGLGLSICKRLVELMGGRIGVESMQGEGSLFWFVIPLEKAHHVVEAAPLLVDVASTEKGSKRILVAEDNTANQKVVLRFFEKLGFRADAVANGLEVLHATERKRYDAIFMDCQMPEMDGYEATRELRRREVAAKKPRVPIIALTAHALTGSRSKCLESGMDDYITKPIVSSVLKEVLEKWTADPEPRGANLAGDGVSIDGKLANARRALAILDHEYLKSLDDLQMDGKPDLVLELAEIFYKAVPDGISKIARLVSTNDLGALGREAHALKSTCRTIGAQSMGWVCEQIEYLPASSDGDKKEKAEQLVEALRVEFKRVETELSSVVDQRNNTPT